MEPLRPGTPATYPSSTSGWMERVREAGRGESALKGKTFGVKDLFDVAGTVTGNGNPDFKRVALPADRHSPAVQVLLDAGAVLVGTTHMDEMAYSINGENHFYGTPLNPAAPGRIPGGSSSGSASVVAAGEADFALACRASSALSALSAAALAAEVAAEEAALPASSASARPSSRHASSVASKKACCRSAQCCDADSEAPVPG